MIAILSGCATWVVDSDVRSYSRLAAVPANAAYRFERLPSQEADAVSQASLEAMAGAALDRVGMRRDDARARFSAQVEARVTTVLSPLADPWMRSPGFYGPGFYGRGAWGGVPGAWRPGWGGGWGGGWDSFQASNPWYVREVGLVLRELASGQVVYETRARHEGPYHRSADIFPVLFIAALEGFPNPPLAERRVDLPLSAGQPRP